MNKKSSEKFHLANILYNLKHYRYSLTRLGILFLAILLLTSVLSMVSISSYYTDELRTQYYDNVDTVLTHFNNEVAKDFNTVESFFFQLGQYNTDVSTLNTTDDLQKFYHAKMSVYQTLINSSTIFPYLDGLFVYSSKAEDYTAYSTPGSNQDCSNHIALLLSQNRDSLNQKRDLYRKWQLYHAADADYLIRYILSGNTVLGAWMNLDTFSKTISPLFDGDSVVCYMDEEHHILQKNLFPDYVYEPRTSDAYQIYLDPSDRQEYLTVVQKVKYSDCSIAVFLPLQRIHGYLRGIYQRYLLVSIVVLLCVLLISIGVKRMVDVPFRAMNAALSSLQEGNEEIVLPPSTSHCMEIQQMNDTLDSLLTQIRNLKIKIYEEKLAQSRLELQFLKSQISPHFLINCLTSFSFLASSSEDNKYLAHRLTETLSSHIRYAFISRELIPLSQELEQLDNYLELSSIRYPQSLAYRIRSSPGCEECQLPPMLLLTLCENTIKHNLIMGELLKIRVDVSTTDTVPFDNPGMYYHISYVDSGSGYPAEVLDLNNHILEHEEITRDGHHIGIYNIVKTLYLSYHNNARICFSNDSSLGARADIYIPCITHSNKETDL